MTFSVESVEIGKKQIVVIESRDRKLSPHEIVDDKGEIVAMKYNSSVKLSCCQTIENVEKVKR